jgi:hypothetical protein
MGQLLAFQLAKQFTAFQKPVLVVHRIVPDQPRSILARQAGQ